MSKPGGFPAISRWLSEARATPPDSRRMKIRIPEGCQQMRSGAGWAMIGEALRSLRDRVIGGHVVRGCCSAQPPANGWHPSGMACAAQAGGLEAISRWSRRNATTPPGWDEKNGRIPEGWQRWADAPTRFRDGLRSLRDRVRFAYGFRGYRCAQSPANGWHPSGMAAARVDEHLLKMGAVWK